MHYFFRYRWRTYCRKLSQRTYSIQKVSLFLSDKENV